MAEKTIQGTVGETAKSAVEAVEGAVEGAVSAVEGAVKGAVETAAEVAHQTAHQSELTGIAFVVLAALLCGMVMERFRQPALVGYILAGVLLGPSALAVVEGREQIDVLAELGVLMLLFIIGMELSLRSFRRIWLLAMTVTIFQVSASVGMMLLLSLAFEWPVPLAVLLGFVIALSSTAVAIKILESIGELKTRSGRIAISVLIAQDLAVVPMMIGVSAMGGGGFDWIAVSKILISVAFLVALIMFLSRGRQVRMPFGAMVARHADLKPLAAVAFCFGCAAISGLFGLSAAYGAFIAGMILGNSTERHHMLEVTHPIQSILMMVFFLSIGLLIDLGYIWANLGTVLLLFFFVTFFKTALNVGFLAMIGQPWHHAYVAGMVLSQVGEFSFLLSVVGLEAGVISDEDSRLVVAVTVLSLSLSPVWVITGRRLRGLAERGITSGAELMRMVYEPETELVAETLDKASTKTKWGLRASSIWLRRRRQRQRRRAEAEEVEGEIATEAEEPSEPKEVEIIPPAAARPANDPGPDPPPPENPGEKKKQPKKRGGA